MLAAGIKTPVPLDELESHLREEIAALIAGGKSNSDAFELAVRRIGQADPLRNEFAKIGAPGRTRLQKLKSILLKVIGARTPPAFAPEARQTLELGRQEAIGFHHDFVGTEHVLLGLLGSEAQIVPGLLRRMGVDRRIVRAEIEKVVGCGPVGPANPTIPYTPRAKKALVLATREATAYHHAQVRAEHIFLGLLLEGGGVAALVLKNLGVNAAKAREEILKVLPRNPSGA